VQAALLHRTDHLAMAIDLICPRFGSGHGFKFLYIQ
jgi:hypothetical protein